MSKKYESVWDALEDTPEQAENMKMRSVFMMALGDHIKQTGETQAQAADRLGVTQPRVNDLLNGKIDKFSLDMLVCLAVKSGLKIALDIKAA